MKILFFAKAKVLLTILPANVRSIMPLSKLVTVMIIILNATFRPGVKITDTIRHLVLFLNMLTLPVQVTGLCTKDVKPIMTVLVRILVMSTLVLPDRSLKRPPAAALMIHHMVPAVRRPDVRRILRCLLHLMARTARMAASIPVITPAT